MQKRVSLKFANNLTAPKNKNNAKLILLVAIPGINQVECQNFEMKFKQKTTEIKLQLFNAVLDFCKQ